MDVQRSIFDNLNKAFVFAFLVFLTGVLLRVILNVGYTWGLALSLIPFGIITVLYLTEKPYHSFLLLFTVNYFVSGGTRYFTYPPGITMDIVILLTIFIVLLQFFKGERSVKISDAFNNLTLVAFLWLLYCTFQIFNPESSSPLAWLGNVRGIGIYFFIITALASIFLRKYQNLKTILYLWAIFCLIAVFKAFMQKTFGFDFGEARWLEEGGKNTHIIHSGIRYFSIFTDAGNFGSGIAFSMVVFAISAVQYKEYKMKAFYIFVAAACFYGMIISGTRGSLIIPMSGLALYTALSKNIRAIIPTFAILIFAIWFLNFTYIGQGNVYVRRMRSVFNPDDASLGARLENQALLRTQMIGKPLGIGIGMKRGNAVLYTPHPVLSKIPHDSWYVLIWVELGIVGLVSYVLMILYILIHGSYLVLFRLKNRELRGLIAALLCGLFGVSLAAYSLEIFGQMPNSILIYISMTFIFLSPIYDKELEESAYSNEEPIKRKLYKPV